MGEMSCHLNPCNRLFPHHSPLAEQMRNKGGWDGNVQATGRSPLVEKSPHVAKSRRRENIIEDGKQELVYEHDKVAPAAHALALCRILNDSRFSVCSPISGELAGEGRQCTEGSKNPGVHCITVGFMDPLSQIQRRVFQERASITSQLVEIQRILWI
jgi:hypothetical protein